MAFTGMTMGIDCICDRHFSVGGAHVVLQLGMHSERSS